MKTFSKRVLVVVVFMLGTLFNYASDVVSEDIIGTKKVKVVFENVEKGQLLTVKDYRGHVLHEEYISVKGNLVKVFDFSHLKEGYYKIEVDKKSEILIKPFQLKLNKVTFKEDIKKEVKKPVKKKFFKPVVKINEENVIMVSRINFDKKPIRVSIYYKGDVILHEKVRSEEAVNSKTYKLNEEQKGDYKVVVQNNGESFVSKFSI